MDAMGQLFFSISVAMGIMVAYGSYAPKDANLMKSINRIEIFDTLIALLAGLMIIPSVFTFMGKDGMSAGPGLMFVSLPRVFLAMGKVGNIVGLVFFLIVAFAAVTSSVSVMEAIVSSIMDRFGYSRKKSAVIVSVYTLIVGVIVCLGYSLFYFELPLPNGTVGQILDVLDYISNNCLMPLVALLTCILIGWVVKPKTVIDEVTQGKYKFGRKWLYIAMIKVVAPLMLILLLIQSVGLLKL
jgi:NSS family neurotransmitter:Na+ symporter